MYRLALSGGFFFILLIAQTSFGDAYSTGPMGIDSSDLGLTGDGIAIGMVEVDRPGVPDFDMANVVHDSVVPAGVFRNDLPSQPYTIVTAMADESVGGHPLEVAGIMISTDPILRGVAPEASLYASGMGDEGTLTQQYDRASTSLQFIANLNFSDVRAVNVSLGLLGSLDGNSQFTLFLDWSARIHDTLYVVAGDQLGDPPVGAISPRENYNGMTIARSTQDANGLYRLVDQDNFVAPRTDNRTVIDLLAPGNMLQTTEMNNQTGVDQFGTSFAAPHVTGTVALLQEFAENRIPDMPHWTDNARHHEVMKAVLMNSADKLEDSGNGNRLGMTRTVLDRNGNDWTTSDAAMNPGVPLHEEFGTGHLNARRALQQFSPGEWSVNGEGEVPLIGWDLGVVDGVVLDANKYIFDEPLKGDSYVSITLVWDRVVTFETDTAPLGEFNSGDTFKTFDGVLVPEDSFNNLDLWLMPRGAPDYGQAIAASISSEMNVEHIFAEIPTTGEYEIWVEQFSAHLGQQQYAVAWWAVGLGGPAISGDYDGSGSVDMDDYDLWVANFGFTSNLDADGNGNGIIDAADYTVWRDNFGAGSGSVAAVPEPSGWALLALAGAYATIWRWPMRLDA